MYYRWELYRSCSTLMCIGTKRQLEVRHYWYYTFFSVDGVCVHVDRLHLVTFSA